jgi:hypothetical protein
MKQIAVAVLLGVLAGCGGESVYNEAPEGSASAAPVTEGSASGPATSAPASTPGAGTVAPSPAEPARVGPPVWAQNDNPHRNVDHAQ